MQITDQQGETKYNYQQGKYQNFHNVSIYIETLHNLQIKMKKRQRYLILGGLGLKSEILFMQ